MASALVTLQTGQVYNLGKLLSDNSGIYASVSSLRQANLPVVARAVVLTNAGGGDFYFADDPGVSSTHYAFKGEDGVGSFNSQSIIGNGVDLCDWWIAVSANNTKVSIWVAVL